MDKNYYFELVIKPSSHYELFLDFLLEVYQFGLEEFEDSFILRGEEPFDDIVWAVKYFKDELEKNLKIEINLDISTCKKENKDWIENFKKSIKPIFIDPFYIHPSWYPPKDNAKNILLDPALAFGSGHHETTSSVIEILKDIVNPKETVLDVGVGSGILSLISAKMGATIDFCDIDPLSVESATDNFSKNSLDFRKNWEGSANGTDQKYSLVIANIIPDVIIAISTHLKKRVQAGGKIVLSGILEGRETLVLEYFDNFKLIKKIQKGEWITILLEKGEK